MCYALSTPTSHRQSASLCIVTRTFWISIINTHQIARNRCLFTTGSKLIFEILSALYLYAKLPRRQKNVSYKSQRNIKTTHIKPVLNLFSEMYQQSLNYFSLKFGVNKSLPLNHFIYYSENKNQSICGGKVINVNAWSLIESTLIFCFNRTSIIFCYLQNHYVICCTALGNFSSILKCTLIFV